jgi:hypothetical protein
MDETGKVVAEDVAVSELPEKVRGDFEPDAVVGVTLEARPDAPAESAEPQYLKFAGIAAYKNTSIAEAVDRVRALRDEWD